MDYQDLIPNGMGYEDYLARGPYTVPPFKWHVVGFRSNYYRGEEAVMLVKHANLGQGWTTLETPEDRVVYRYPSSFNESLYWLNDGPQAILAGTTYEIFWSPERAMWFLDIKDAGAAMLFKLTHGGVV